MVGGRHDDGLFEGLAGEESSFAHVLNLPCLPFGFAVYRNENLFGGSRCLLIAIASRPSGGGFSTTQKACLLESVEATLLNDGQNVVGEPVENQS